MQQPYSGMVGFIHFLSTWFTRLAVPNLLWFLVLAPVWLVLLTYGTGAGTWVVLLPLLLLVPILVFPGTAALFALARDWMRGDDQPSLVSAYFSFVKEMYKKAVLSGAAWTGVWGIWIVDFRFFLERSDLLMTVALIIGILLAVMNLHFFSMLVHYRMTIPELFRNSFLLTVGRPVTTVVVALLAALVIYASTTLWFLVIFFTCSLLACMSFYLFYRSYLKIKEKA